MNSFVGPPIGSVLLAIGFAFPFFFDAGTFALAAGAVQFGTARGRRVINIVEVPAG